MILKCLKYSTKAEIIIPIIQSLKLDNISNRNVLQNRTFFLYKSIDDSKRYK